MVFAISLSALMKGADFLIEGSSGIARKLGVSDLVVGLTVIAIGTSLPELVVSIRAVLSGNGDLALANVIGSNITNILLVIGVTATIKPLTSPHGLKKRDVPFSLVLALAFLGMVTVSADLYFSTEYNKSNSTLHRWGGVLLLIFFVTFIASLFKAKDEGLLEKAGDEQVSHPWARTAIGTLLIIAGGKFTVESAVAIAQSLGVSETTIGLTIVAFGTSLPELVASIVAARKGLSDMALGNVVGSNIMNLAMVLGTAGAIAPIRIGAFETIDITFMTIISLVFLGLVARKREPQIARKTGIFFVLVYLGYMTYIASRASW